MKICVAVSGGKDSMALLHLLKSHAQEYGITLSALNCEHGLRGSASLRDSAFVAQYCRDNDIPLKTFSADCALIAKQTGASVEEAARTFRYGCYLKAFDEITEDCAVATAHHKDDNAETVLFNLARGSAVGGLCGIRDGFYGNLRIIRPLINFTRADIDKYIAENRVPFVEDESNFGDDYTRNRIRHTVLPALESAVPGAADGIFRLSRLAAEDENYFAELIQGGGFITDYRGIAVFLRVCDKFPVFGRAAVRVIRGFGKKDYTESHVRALYALQSAPRGNKYRFLGLTVCNDGERLVFTDNRLPEPAPVRYNDYAGGAYGGMPLEFTQSKAAPARGLYFDADKIPQSAVIRFRRDGDRFKKFGGGEKSLGDFFTDRKIPPWQRNFIPLIADGARVLAVCGVEISEEVKADATTENYTWINCTL